MEEWEGGKVDERWREKVKVSVKGMEMLNGRKGGMRSKEVRENKADRVEIKCGDEEVEGEYKRGRIGR